MTSRKMNASERDELEGKLRRMLAPEEDIGFELLIDMLATPVSSSNADAAKAAARTRDYKVKQILAGAPESGDVSSACAFLLLKLFQRKPEHAAVKAVVALLEEAGFDPVESEKAVLRLANSAADREVTWRKRVKRRHTTRLVVALRGPSSDSG